MSFLEYPPRAQVLEHLKAGWAVPLAWRLPERVSVPVLFSSFVERAYPFLLDSARCHPITGRTSFLGCDPRWVIRAKGSRCWVGSPGHLSPSAHAPLETLRQMVAIPSTIPVEGLPPFVGGAVGIFGYDVGRWFERLPAMAQDDLHLPDLVVGLYETIVAVDHATEAAWVITRALPGPDVTQAYDEAVARLDTFTALLSREPETPISNLSLVPCPLSRFSSTHTCAEFEAMVRQAKAWIASGEIYQANLSQRLSAVYHGDPWTLYQRLRAVNPSPFAGYFDAGEAQLVCGSPERLVRFQGGIVETRPIAGTRSRTGQDRQDRKLLAELIAHPKERAEHLMLVDLERNDLGRVCRYGSVEVTELMALEAYSHVFHIVSNIRGELADGLDGFDVIRAMFPGGTITGCPKIRAIELIDRLEPVRRQWYTGSLGYLSFSGAVDLNLVIRSAIVTGGRVHVQVGAGIVADSDPTREYEETWHKAQALLVALHGAAEPQPYEMDHAVAVG